MKLFVFSICCWQAAALVAIAQELPHPSPSRPEAQATPSLPAKAQPSPEMKKLLGLSGRWYFHFEYESTEGSPEKQKVKSFFARGLEDALWWKIWSRRPGPGIPRRFTPLLVG